MLNKIKCFFFGHKKMMTCSSTYENKESNQFISVSNDVNIININPCERRGILFSVVIKKFI